MAALAAAGCSAAHASGPALAVPAAYVQMPSSGNSTVGYLDIRNNGTADQLGCGVLSLMPTGTHVLVACFGFGRVDGDRFTALPGFPSPSSSGITGQTAAAW